LVHTYALCHAIHSDGVKVVLSGNGADELFYGYTGHLRTLRVSRWLDRTALLRPLLAPFLPSSLGWITAPSGKRKSAYYAGLAQAEWARYLMPGVRPELVNRAAEEMAYWGQMCPSSAFIDESNFVGLMVENTHSVTIAGDLSAMAASIEIRAPFLDQEIVSFALATPVESKIPDSKNPDWLKAILREAVADLVPTELLRASKRGFGMGIQEDMLLRGPWRIHAERVFREPHDAGGLFDPHAIQSVWKNFIAGRESASRVAKLFAIQVWLKNGAICA
jgi:asparagine synthase (glutamine-hydrolysing)